MEPTAEPERALSQWLAHPRGKSIDLPNVHAHRSQIAAASQRCRQDDQIVVVTQLRLQSIELGKEGRDAGQQRPARRS
jgi:hypothetical protein